jgi:hypothetical protein
MRIYKIFDKWIDLDHVLAVEDPKELFISNCGDTWIGFEITMAFINEPLKVYYPNDNDDYGNWYKSYVRPTEVIIYDNDYDAYKQYKLKTDLKEIHQQFINAWQGKVLNPPAPPPPGESPLPRPNKGKI